MFTVFIEGLELYAYHGVSAEERAVGHRYLVDVSLEIDGAADATDAIGDTVDYSSIAAVVQARLSGESRRTVERLAALVAEDLLAFDARVAEATVTVAKPLPPMPFVAESAGATVVRSRG